MTIRVLHIIGSLRLGGAQVCLKQIVEHNDDPNIEHFVYPLRCRQVDIPIKGNILSNPYRDYDPRKFFDILRICKEHNIDIIHAHLHKPILGALLTTYFQKIPVIVHEHGAIARPGIQYTFFRFLLRLLKKRATRFIAVSKAAAQQLTDFAGVEPACIQVIYNAVDLDKFKPNPSLRESIRGELDISPDTVVIGFLGRLSYVKGPDILLDAFCLLLERKPDCTLVFLGDGKMKQALISRAAKLGIDQKVKFPGFKANVADYINAFDIAAITSRQDAFGIAAIELMSMNVPLVSWNVYGLAEIVNHRKNALIPSENSPQRISDCLLELIKDATLRQSLTENASVSVQKFEVPNFIARINETFRSILQTKSKGSQYDK
jgi:glycosyltransferase involved in cell wall biosynthesis